MNNETSDACNLDAIASHTTFDTEQTYESETNYKSDASQRTCNEYKTFNVQSKPMTTESYTNSPSSDTPKVNTNSHIKHTTTDANTEDTLRNKSTLQASVSIGTSQIRMNYLEQLIHSRRSDWQYLKTVHEGMNYWYNTALITDEQYSKLGSKRTLQLYYLGLGLGKLLEEVHSPQYFAVEACQLLEEIDFYFGSNAAQSMKLMVATQSSRYPKLLSQVDKTGNESFRPTIYKWNQRPMYRWLVTQLVPFELDYAETMVSLCELLNIVYSKLMEDNTSFENVFFFQSTLRFDRKLKKIVIDAAKKEYATIASSIIRRELEDLPRSSRLCPLESGHA